MVNQCVYLNRHGHENNCVSVSEKMYQHRIVVILFDFLKIPVGQGVKIKVNVTPAYLYSI